MKIRTRLRLMVHTISVTLGTSGTKLLFPVIAPVEFPGPGFLPFYITVAFSRPTSINQ